MCSGKVCESDENSKITLLVAMASEDLDGWGGSIKLDCGSSIGSIPDALMEPQYQSTFVESCIDAYFDIFCEEDPGVASWTVSGVPTPIFSHSRYIDEIVTDLKTRWLLIIDNVDDSNSTYWTGCKQGAPFTAPFCGICVLGYLHASSRDHLLNRHCSDSIQSHNDSRRRTWSSCHSTKTLISKIRESSKGTGRWFLDHEQYNQWHDRPSSFLWLCGQPGAGKSVLMSTVIRDLQKTRRSGELVVYYFANGHYQGVSTAKAILCSMLGQLLFREPVRESFEEVLPLINDLAAISNPLSATKMIRLFSKIRHRLRSHETLYLLLDGLDEGTDSPRERDLVIDLVDHASRHDPEHQIKCLVSSRSTFFGNKLPKGALRVDLDCNSLTRGDMSIYVQDNLYGSVYAYSAIQIQELEKQLLSSAAGSFLWLRLLLEHCRSDSGNNKENFPDFLIHLNEFGQLRLDEIYRRMLASIENCNKVTALSILRWVTFAARPLTSEELFLLNKQGGIEIKQEDISNISAGLLTCSGNLVQFTHLSVREYLESRLSASWEELSNEANEMIAHACLKLLSPEDLLQSLNLATNDSRSADSIVPGFVPYARTHWIIHYKRAERRSSYIAGLLHDILEKSLKTLTPYGHLLEENMKQKAEMNPGSSPCAEHRHDQFRSPDTVNIALGIGARFGFTKLSQLELDMGANPNAPSGPDQQTPLCQAASGGHLDVVRLLLQRGADPSIATRLSLTPMSYAMANGHHEIQDLLMQYSEGDKYRNSCYSGLSVPQHADQEFCLSALITTSCTSCAESAIDYELRAMPEISYEGKVLPPVLVSGETISKSELQLSIVLMDVETSSRVSIVVKWYAGVVMYRILHSASKLGINEVKRLLLAAGNDKDSLDMITSLSDFLARTSL